MDNYMWNTPEKLRALLCEIVSWDSRTLTEGENEFAYKLKNKLMALPYFNKHPELIELHEAGLGRNAVTALYKHPTATNTVVLISHFDTVHTEEYGELEPLAVFPEELTKKLMEPKYKRIYQKLLDWIWNQAIICLVVAQWI